MFHYSTWRKEEEASEFISDPPAPSLSSPARSNHPSSFDAFSPRFGGRNCKDEGRERGRNRRPPTPPAWLQSDAECWWVPLDLNFCPGSLALPLCLSKSQMFVQDRRPSVGAKSLLQSPRRAVPNGRRKKGWRHRKFLVVGLTKDQSRSDKSHSAVSI